MGNEDIVLEINDISVDIIELSVEGDFDITLRSANPWSERYAARRRLTNRFELKFVTVVIETGGGVNI